MIVTVMTDASFSHKHLIGTYAFYVVSDKGKFFGSGKLRDQCLDSTEAEMKAIVNAMHALSKKEDVNKNARKIIINTDSMNAVHIFSKNKPKIKKYKLDKQHYNEVRDTFFKIRKKIVALEIEIRHVEAHSNKTTARHVVNGWLDTAAKKEMEKLIGPIIDPKLKVIKNDSKLHKKQ